MYVLSCQLSLAKARLDIPSCLGEAGRGSTGYVSSTRVGLIGLSDADPLGLSAVFIMNTGEAHLPLAIQGQVSLFTIQPLQLTSIYRYLP